MIEHAHTVVFIRTEAEIDSHVHLQGVAGAPWGLVGGFGYDPTPVQLADPPR